MSDLVTLLLHADGSTAGRALREAPLDVVPSTPPRSRTVYAAAHVVPNAWADNTPGSPAEIDWDSTLAFRRHLWAAGLGVADAMDTAQRNLGLDWTATAELMRRSAAESRAVGGALVVGVNTDHLTEQPSSLQGVVDAYRFQLDTAESAGAGAVFMASRHLAVAARSPEDYRTVYRGVLEHAQAPVVLHWLGAAFDPALTGYFGSVDLDVAIDTVVEIIEEHREHVSGIKVSLLDMALERRIRERLPHGVTLFTGDDYHYVELIEGDADGRYSDALLGAFAAVGPRAAVALQALDEGDTARYRAVLGPTEVLARHIFASPTPFYKTGVAFLSWLNGHQPAFAMVGGLHSARSLVHLSEIVRLADDAGALEQPRLAARRWTALLDLNGVRP